MVIPFRHPDPAAELRAWLGQLKNRIAARREAERKAMEA